MHVLRSPSALSRRVVAMGVVLCVLATGLTAWTAWQIVSSHRTTGEVTEIRALTSSNPTGGVSHVYIATFRFIDHEGNPRSAKTADASSLYDFAEGDEVPLLFDPADPEHVTVAIPRSVWSWPALAWGVAILVLLLGRWLR